MKHKKLLVLVIAALCCLSAIYLDLSSHRVNTTLASQIITFLKLPSSQQIEGSPYAKILDSNYINKTPVIQNGLVTTIIASFAKIFIGAKPAGFVIGNTIFLTSSEKVEYQIPILTHELVHIEQIKQLSYPIFLFQYIKEYLASGYRNISFENQAYEFENKVINAIINSSANP